MVKLILFHPGIGIKQKLYLMYQYCICYYIDYFLYMIEKYFIELNIFTKKVQKKVKFYRKDIDFIQKQKDKLFQHIIDNYLGFDQVNKILKVAGVLGNSGIDLLNYVTTNIDFIHWYKNQSEKIKKKLSLYEFDE